MQKGFAVVYLILAVATIIAVGAGAYYLGKSSSPQLAPTPFSPPPSSALPIPVDKNASTSAKKADWKTYRNIPFNLNFRYPSNWYVGEQQNVIYVSPNPIPSTLLVHGLPDALQISFSVTPFEILKPIWKHSTSSVTINDISGTKVIDQEPNRSDGLMRTKIVVNNSANNYLIVFSNTDNNGNHNQIFDQILSTFKFTTL